MAIQVCKSKKECIISFASAKAFEESVRAVIEELRYQAIDQEDLLAGYAMFELLPDTAKQALSNSRWWINTHNAKISNEYKIQDAYPAPQLLSQAHWWRAISPTRYSPTSICRCGGESSKSAQSHLLHMCRGSSS